MSSIILPLATCCAHCLEKPICCYCTLYFNYFNVQMFRFQYKLNVQLVYL